MGRLRTLKTSQRNWKPYRSLIVKFLKIDKSKLLNPESRKMLRPMLPKLPSAGGTRTELPFVEIKQPKLPSVAVPAVALPWAWAKQFAIPTAAPEPVKGVPLPPTYGFVKPQLGPAVLPKPLQKGMLFLPAGKSSGLPKMSQRSAFSPVPLILSPESQTDQGCGVE